MRWTALLPDLPLRLPLVGDFCPELRPLSDCLHSLTSVGATTGITETAASFSSGGFSNIFSRPSYQDTAVSTYLKKLGKTNAGLFNSTGRGFPDIAAQAQSFQIIRAGKTVSVSGTSAASPTVGSLVALLNDAIFNDRGKALGFLNPFLYKFGPGALNDITQGSNPGCGTDGFAAADGWDPVCVAVGKDI